MEQTQAQDSDILSVFNDPSSLRKMIDKLDGPVKKEYNALIKQKVNERLQKQTNEQNYKNELHLKLDKTFNIFGIICLIVCFFSFVYYVHCLNTNNESCKSENALPGQIIITLSICVFIFGIWLVNISITSDALSKKYNIPTLDDIIAKNKRKYDNY